MRLAGLLVALLGFAAGLLGMGWWQAVRATPAEPGPVDIGFAQSMSRHHQQAIDMALRMLDGKPTALTGFAQLIAHTQQFELGQMRGWLQLWGQPMQAPSDRGMGWMLMGNAPPDAALQQYLLDCQRAVTGMAGLASDAELAQLRQLQGRARDQLFLKLMLAHHAGALPMARFAAGEAQLIPVRELAQRIVWDQTREMGRMVQMQQVLASTPEAPSQKQGDAR